MNKTLLAVLAALAVAGGAYFLLRPPDTDRASAPPPPEGAPLVAVTLPDAHSDAARRGKTVFEAVCADCHGTNAAGKMGFGPPLVHRIYEPGHHGDMAFVLAVQNGVPAHHWPFGAMPPQAGLTRAEVIDITTYVRELQRTNGIN